jgi:hypothetical protein
MDLFLLLCFLLGVFCYVHNTLLCIDSLLIKNPLPTFRSLTREQWLFIPPIKQKMKYSNVHLHTNGICLIVITRRTKNVKEKTKRKHYGHFQSEKKLYLTICFYVRKKERERAHICIINMVRP